MRTSNEQPAPILTSSLFLGVHPFVAPDAEEEVAADEPACEESQSVCPYRRQEAARVVGDTSEMGSLKQAVKGLDEVRRLAETGAYGAALECLENVRTMCPEAARRVEAVKAEIATAQKEHEACEQTAAAEGCCGCCFAGMLSQFGMCWMSGLADFWMTYSRCAASSSVAAGLQTPVTISSEGKPLSQVCNELRAASGLPITIDKESLKKAGIASLDDIFVTFHVAQTPLQVALDLLLRPYHLGAEVRGADVFITAKAKDGRDLTEALEETLVPTGCGSACPKCEAMHAKYVATREQVTGLMKACYLAIGEGRFEKAADLAREAHQLDPARVEGDPLIYKMHLLAEKERKCCPKAKGKKGCSEKAPETKAAPPSDEPGLLLRTELPEIRIDVPALDAILTGNDELSKPVTPEKP